MRNKLGIRIKKWGIRNKKQGHAACNGPAFFSPLHSLLLSVSHDPHSVFLFEQLIFVCVLRWFLCVLSRISKAFNHELHFLNATKIGMFRNKCVDMRHATWRTPQAVQVLCANFPKSLSWCFPSVLDRQTKLYTYSAIFSFSSPLGVLEHSSFGIYRFKADHFLSMHCVPCVLCPRLRVLRVNSILT